MTGASPKVSVVIIFLNAEKFITESIESVLAQTYHNWELLLVDDGSSDQSTSIAQKYARQFPDKIRYLEHPGHRNRGKSASRNLGVQKAKGEYIAFLDADDIFLPEKLKTQAVILDNNPQAAMAYSPTFWWFGWTNKEEDIKRDWMAKLGVIPNQILQPPELMTLYLRKGAYIPCICGLLVRRNILGAEGGWKENFKNLYEDQVFLAQIVLNHPVYVHEGLHDKYRQHPDMSSNEAIRKGEYNPDPSKPNASQFAYFSWLSSYISRHKFSNDKNLRDALAKRLAPYKNPFLKKIEDRLNKRGLILMYHRISKLNFDPRQLSVSPSNLENHLRIIKKYGHPVQMQEMGKNLKKLSLGAKEIVLTFDDGYVDNFQNAKPILEKHNVPATFFIVSGAVGSREEFFWDGLERTILASQTLPEIFEVTIDNKKFRWQLKPEGQCLFLDYSQARVGIPPDDTVLSRAQLYSALGQILGPLSESQRRGSIRDIAQWSGQILTVRPDSLPMTADQLLSLASCSLFEIGAHTVNHPSLAKLPLEKQEEEILHSKKDLENRLTRSITSFSYPHGSYTEDTVKVIERLNFRNACTVVAKPVLRNSDPYLLPRFSVSDWSGDEFEKNLKHWMAQYE